MTAFPTQLHLDQNLLPSASDIAFYQEHGWYISKKIFTDDQIDELLAASDRFYAGDRDGRAPVPLKPFLDWQPEHGPDVVRMNDHIVFQSNVIRNIALSPIIGAIAAALAGTSEIRLFNSSMAYKPAGLGEGRGRVGWHTDTAYWQTCSSRSMLTAWIPLHDCTVALGPVSFIDRSHLWPADSTLASSLMSGKTFVTPDFDALQAQLKALGHPFEIVPAVMPKGHVSFHHCALFHGSLENQTSHPRRNLIVHMQDKDNHFIRKTGPDGESLRYNSDQAARTLPSGDPDYADPDLFPSIWRAP